jgi:hypothetical protein
MGDDGNEYFSALELPALKRMIMGPTGGSALDLAMANSLARWLAQEGFSVIATDGATAILEQAQTRTALWREEGKIAKGQEISFHLLDMTSTDHWAQFIASSHQTVSLCCGSRAPYEDINLESQTSSNTWLARWIRCNRDEYCDHGYC